MNSTLIDYLQRYLSLGWHLSPCSSKTKAPILVATKTCKGGWYRASPDVGDWINWMGEYDGCLWGVRPLGFAVLDADRKHGGLERLAELTAIHGELPRTPTTRTGGGGRHYYFKTNWTGNRYYDCDGLELIADVKGVILSPSVHPETGIPYDWEIAPWDCPMAELPEWLLSSPKAVTLPSASAEIVWAVGFDNLPDLPAEGRNKDVADAVIQEKIGRTPEDECVRKGLEWARRQEPAFNENDLRRKVKSIYANPAFKSKNETAPSLSLSTTTGRKERKLRTTNLLSFLPTMAKSK